MTARIELKGKTYGLLTVLKRVGIDDHKHSLWRCECECGNEITVNHPYLTNVKNPSCGCIPNDRGKKAKQKAIDAYAYAKMSNQFMNKIARKNLTKFINRYEPEYPDNTIDEFARGIK